MTTPTDPLFVSSQWHLNPALSDFGVNAVALYDEFTGAGVRVAILDEGVDTAHVDLDGNVLASLGYNAMTDQLGVGFGTPQLSTDNHGTAVAGIIGAERNNQGVVGIAYESDLIPIYVDLAAPNATFLPAVVRAYDHARLNADIINNSWGFRDPFEDDFASPAFAAAAAAIENAADNGRGGLGLIIVQAAGNEAADGNDTNLHNFQNNRFTITVAATLDSGVFSDYSTPGASILVSAPGGPVPGDIATTDRTGTLGFNALPSGAGGDYTDQFNGTSAAAPMVSGVVALVLDANPGLGWRDVQYILAATARQIDPANLGWAENGATGFNGGGAHVSHDYGFGLVDAFAATRVAESWLLPAATSANELAVTAAASPFAAIPDDDPVGITSTINIASSVLVERAEVRLNIAHSFVGDLVVDLTSPLGTISRLIARPLAGQLATADILFTTTTTHSLGEGSAGTWTLRVSDEAALDTGVLNSWTLNLYGRGTADDTYIYTDEYATLGAADAARRSVSDADGGTDTVNAAAVTTGSAIRLDGVAGAIAGVSATFAATIENAVGGDGGDTITGNALANRLYGMRGADTLNGADGSDLLYGGVGNDTLNGDGGDDRLQGAEGNDTLNGGGNGALGDIADYAGAAAGVTVSLAVAGPQDTGGAGTDTLNGIERLYGSAHNDSFTGDGGANEIVAFAGDDWLDGGAGADGMYGGLGNDTYIIDNAGDIAADPFNGGTDIVFASVTHTLSANIENLTLTGAGAITGNGNALANTIIGNGAANTLYGAAGDDILDGAGGSDFLYGGTGNDTFHVDVYNEVVSDTGGTDIIFAAANYSFYNRPTIENLTLTGSGGFYGVGNALANTITGNAGNNTLYGRDGADTLIGGIGADILWGDGGADIIRYLSLAESTFAFAGRDVIGGFNASLGDRIDLSAIDADATLGGDQAFVWIGNGLFTGPGQLGYTQSGSEVLVRVNVDADLTSDMLIRVAGHPAGISPTAFIY
ncbi:MAG: S8 family serine peptidase [Alphaproteobacteria bacterium]|nr:S8 family serine peptidase [Alphaproteobacteria bacterium]